MLLAIIKALRDFRAFQQNLHELNQLSDRELADMGVRRSDIPAIAAGVYRP